VNVDDMAYISNGLRGGKVLISGGYRYHKNIETNDKIWWRCWRKTCRASLSTNIFDLKDDNPITQEIGLAGAYRTKAKLRKCLQKFMAIGYLPLALVRQNFHTYVGSGLVTRCLQRYPQLQRFIQYMDANYVSANALFPPKIWNVFQRTSDTRTNNFVEGKLALIFKVALAYFLQKSYFIRHVFSCYYLKIEPTCAITYYAC
jgi:hypothetical protein